MSKCGAYTDVEVWEDDDASQTVTCSLPKGHAEAHQGVVLWSTDLPGQEQR